MSDYKIGFTGTRNGMTEFQKESLFGVLDYFGLRDNRIVEIHHGDCIGADDEFDNLVFEMFDKKNIVRYIHPPVDTAHQAHCADKKRWFKETIVLPPYTHLKRNRHVVEASDIVIATPEQSINPGWGGTWFTYDYANKLRKMTYLIEPSGNVTAKGEPLEVVADSLSLPNEKRLSRSK